METVLMYLTTNIRKEIEEYLQRNYKEIEEIRIRANKKIAVKTSKGNEILDYTVLPQEVQEIFEKICENSIYSYKRQICEGFITLKGGHRVGITGNCVFEDGKVININYVSSLNFRIAREKKECSNNIIPYIIDLENKEIFNTLIASKPGCGKTTVLRDIIRKISNGLIEFGIEAKTCGVVDERGEITAMYKGMTQNDVGMLTDVVSNISKNQGMSMLIRSMAPEIIACDEIGSKEDVDAINYAICCGVKGIFTVHANNLEELMLNFQINELLNKNIIERIVFLDDKVKGNFKQIYKLDKKNKKYI